MLTEKQIAELDLKPEILAALREALKPMQVHDIYLRGDTDHDGDAILRIYINLSGERPKNMIIRTTIISRVMDILERHGIEDFPSVTLMDEQDFQDNIGDKFYAIA